MVRDAQITQRQETFLPNVAVVTAGSTVYFLNEDEFFHNVFSLSPRARFNIGRRPPGNVYGQKINKAGTIKLGCDIHGHMSATIYSLNTPFFTKVNEDGSYRIQGLPDGEYEVRAFHPKLQTYIATVNLQNGGTKSLSLNMKN